MTKVITREREKLYEQMEENFEILQPLQPNKLFLHLRTQNKNRKISFDNYSEFLNILNTILLFYSCSNNLQNFPFDILILILMDSSFLIFSLLFHFITRIKKIHKDNSRLSFLLAFIEIILSKLIFQENFELKHKNLFFSIISIIFLFSYYYSTKSNQTSSSITKFSYTTLAFLVTSKIDSLLLKLRICLYAINYFEFIPEIRKFLANYSRKHNLFVFCLNTLTIMGFLMYFRDISLLYVMILSNCFVLFIYPLIFNFYYKEKRAILGLWNLPKVISYY